MSLEPTTIPTEPVDATDDRRHESELYAERVRALRTHAGVAAAVVLILSTANLMINHYSGLADDWPSWWSLWALVGNGVGLAVHALVVRANRPQESA